MYIIMITYSVASLVLPHLFTQEGNVLKIKLISKYCYECIMQHKNYSWVKRHIFSPQLDNCVSFTISRKLSL